MTSRNPLLSQTVTCSKDIFQVFHLNESALEQAQNGPRDTNSISAISTTQDTCCTVQDSLQHLHPNFEPVLLDLQREN